MKALVILKITFLLALFLSLFACTPTQRPLKNGQGYVVVPAGENHFRIEYYLKHAKLAETYWNTTAGQLCPGGFQVLYNKKHVLNFDMYVPIAGNNVNLGRQEFIQYGEVACEGEPSNTIALTESKWREFNAETKSVKPVSDRWLTEALRLYVGHLPNLPVTQSASVLEKEWGKPWKQDYRGAEKLSIWMKGGDAWYQNYIGLIERDGCLHLVMVLPGLSGVMAVIADKANLPNKSLESLIATGAVPAYFYKPVNCGVIKGT